MPSLKDIRKRIGSVKNTQQITKAMKMVAAARLRKAQESIETMRPYSYRLKDIIAQLAARADTQDHPLLAQREPKRVRLLVMTSDRGLCGGFNSGAVRLGIERRQQLMDDLNEVRVEMSGKRGVSAFAFRDLPLDESFTHFEDQPRFDEVEVIANRYLDAYVTGELDRVDVVYTRFISTARQQAVCETLLPLESLGDAADDSEEDGGGESMYEFLPSAASILEEVVPTSFKVKLFKCFLDSAVSEQISRMVAMKSATENADQMIKDLSMKYNRARQGQITGELLELMGGVEALKG